MTISELTRAIIGIENRTAQEVFDIMCDRFKHSRTTADTEQDGKGVKVKGLEWTTPEQDWLKADSPWGTFLICDQPMFGKAWRSFSPAGWPTYSGDSREEVQLKTEADYRQRILSCLDLSTLSNAPQQEAATHRHKKRGTAYVLIGIGRMQAEGWGAFTFDQINEAVAKGQQFIPADNREVAVYRSATDPAEIWVRPREEFEDGRFEELTSPPPASPAPSQDGVVTDEIVWRAVNEYRDQPATLSDFDKMRAALEAALNKGGE